MFPIFCRVMYKSYVQSGTFLVSTSVYYIIRLTVLCDIVFVVFNKRLDYPVENCLFAFQDPFEIL